MMMEIRKAHDRGMADFGWLQSAHTFSFGQYYDPEQMGHGQLVVINDDTVAPNAGFATHPHRNMEIISYVLEGAIAHKDSQGNEFVVPAGEFQIMSAGSGITHSEYNANDDQALKFLQIWIKPNVLETEPSYEQKHFANDKQQQLILSPEGEAGSLRIKQNAWLQRLTLVTHDNLIVALKHSNTAYLHVAKGEVTLNDTTLLTTGDGVKLLDESQVQLTAGTDAEVLLFEV